MSEDQKSRARRAAETMPADLKELNRRIGSRIREIREALPISSISGKRPTPSQRRALQQESLAEILGLPVRNLRAYEAGRREVPAAVLVRLMERYRLDQGFFTAEAPALPPSVQEERLLRRMETLLEDLRARLDQVPASPPPRTEKRERKAGGRGGWLKGLPRKPKTPAQEALVAAWREARAQGMRFSRIEELEEWMKGQGLAAPAPEQAEKETRPPRPRKGKARGRGGWLKGLPRKPKTPAQEALVAAWREARAQGMHFSHIRELKRWIKNRPRQAPAAGEAAQAPAVEEIAQAPAGAPALRGGRSARRARRKAASTGTTVGRKKPARRKSASRKRAASAKRRTGSAVRTPESAAPLAAPEQRPERAPATGAGPDRPGAEEAPSASGAPEQ